MDAARLDGQAMAFEGGANRTIAGSILRVDPHHQHARRRQEIHQPVEIERPPRTLAQSSGEIL